jgi:hypothetical protein
MLNSSWDCPNEPGGPGRENRGQATGHPAAPTATPRPSTREGLFRSYWAVLGVALLGLAAWAVIFLVVRWLAG